jgi:small subunit ribosomal protein S4
VSPPARAPSNAGHIRPASTGQGCPRPSEYRLQLREKQKAKRYYGVRERQFRLYFQRARRASGPVGENLLRGLERPLDNVLYRLGLAGTRAQTRQFVGHRHVLVNGRAGDRPSYEVEPDDVISPKPDAPIEPVGAGRHGAGRRRTRLAPGGSRQPHRPRRAVPERDEVDAPVQEQLIVQLYSK